MSNPISKFLKENFLISFVFFIALILRLINLDQSLWLDEAITAQVIQEYNFLEIITKFAQGDVHPPGHYLFLDVWSGFFGYEEVSIRFPSVIFSLLTIFIVYLLGKKLFNKKVGVLSAIFLTFNPLLIYYSQEARMYSMATFFVVLSTYFLLRIQEKEELRIFPVKKNYITILWIITNFLLLITDYVAYFIFPGQVIFLYLIGSKKVWKIILLIFLSFILSIPFIYTFPSQLLLGIGASNNLDTWSLIVGGNSLKNLFLIPAKLIIGRISFEDKLLYALVIVLSLLIYFLVIIQIERKISEIKLLSIWVVLPIILSYIISFFVPILSYHRLIFIIPAFYLLLAAGLNTIKYPISLAVIIMTLIASLSSISIYNTTPKFQRENWKDAVKFIEGFDKEKTLILFEDNHVPAPFAYYSNSNLNITPALNKIPAYSPNDIVNLKEVLTNKKVVLVFEYLFEINDPSKWLVKIIEDEDFSKKDIFNFSGIGFVTMYEKNFDRITI